MSLTQSLTEELFCLNKIMEADTVNQFEIERANELKGLLNASQDLLEALEALATMQVKGHFFMDRLQFSEEGRIILNKIKNAISKAKGES